VEIIIGLRPGLEGVDLVAGEILQDYDAVFNAMRCLPPGEQLHMPKEIRFTYPDNRLLRNVACDEASQKYRIILDTAVARTPFTINAWTPASNIPSAQIA
jgi:hypothetical protein